MPWIDELMERLYLLEFCWNFYKDNCHGRKNDMKNTKQAKQNKNKKENTNNINNNNSNNSNSKNNNNNKTKAKQEHSVAMVTMLPWFCPFEVKCILISLISAIEKIHNLTTLYDGILTNFDTKIDTLPLMFKCYCHFWANTRRVFFFWCQ